MMNPNMVRNVKKIICNIFDLSSARLLLVILVHITRIITTFPRFMEKSLLLDGYLTTIVDADGLSEQHQFLGYLFVAVYGYDV